MNTNFIKGFLIGLITPVAGFWFYVKVALKSEVDVAFNQLISDNLLTQVVAIAVLFNLLPLFVFNNRSENEQLKGVVGASILYAFTISVLYFFDH